MGRCLQIQSYDLIYLLNPSWAHSPIYLVRPSEWESSQGYFLRTQEKIPYPGEGHTRPVLVQFPKACVKAGTWFCLGWKLHGWTTQRGLWDHLLQELVPHLVLSSCVYRGAARMTLKNFLSFFVCALLPGVKRGEVETPEQWQSAGMILNIIQWSSVSLCTLV